MGEPRSHARVRAEIHRPVAETDQRGAARSPGAIAPDPR